MSKARQSEMTNNDLMSSTQVSGQGSKYLTRQSRGNEQEQYLIRNNYSIFDQDIEAKSFGARGGRSVKSIQNRTILRPSTAFMTQGRSQKKVQLDSANLMQFFRSKEQQCSFEKNVSSLAYRESTLKSKGLDQPYDAGYQNFNELVRQK